MHPIKEKQYKIKSLGNSLDPHFKRKLASMGMLPGATFKVMRIAPLGDPIQIKVNGFELSLRRKELAALKLEDIQNEV